MENKTEKREFIKYLELETADGPLYLYEKYKKDPNVLYNTEIPETREFFTGEEAIRSFNSLLFLDRKCELPTRFCGLGGEVLDDYVNELTPTEFLLKVLPYFETDKTIKRKREEVRNLFEYNAGLTKRRIVKKAPPEITQRTKDEISQKILGKYLK